MEKWRSIFEIALIAVVVGAGALGAAIKIVLFEYEAVRGVWKEVTKRTKKKP